MRYALVTALVLVLAAACADRRPPKPAAPIAPVAAGTALPADHSGFLDDYALLRPGAEGEVAFVYRNPDADWRAYDKVLLEPVTLWRSGRQSLDPIPEDDLLRLVDDLEGSVRKRLGEGYRLVKEPGPGVMRIRLAITEARASDPVLDILRAQARKATARQAGPLHAETRRFVEAAHIEGDIRDARTNQLLAAGVDRRRTHGALPIDTWAEVDRALDAWAERLLARLEARTRAPAAR